MITDNDLNSYTDEQILAGDALCWVIDEHVVYDVNTSKEHGDIFLSATRVEDVSSEYPDHAGITVRLFKDDQALDDFQTSEYFGSVLLSSPTVVNISNHKNGRYVISPDAYFRNYEFEITNREVGAGWHPGKEPEDGQIAKCYSRCQCGWTPSVQE